MPNDLLIRLILQGGIIPGALSLVLLGVFWLRRARRARRAEPDEAPAPGPRWLLPPLIALAFGVADWVSKQSIDLWPTDNTKRALHAALLFGLVGAFENAVRAPAWPALLPRAVAFGLGAWMLIEGYAPHVISTPELWGWVALSALAGPLTVHAAAASLGDLRGWTGPAAGLVLIAAVQPVVHFAGFSSGSLALTGPLAVLSAALIVAVIVRPFSLGSGVVTMLVGLVLLSVLGAGIQSEPKSVPALLLLALSPLALVPAAGGPVRSLALRAALIAVMTGAALLLTTRPA